MNNEPAIQVNSLSKAYRMYHDRAITLKERVLFRRNSFSRHQVLSDVSFEVEWGRSLGLIGRNGSGKSTLLKLLTGIIYPDTGRIDIHGKVSSLLELGAGFHPDFSGRENIYNNASVFGLARRDIDDRYASILEFSELGEYIDSPVRTYSSGMYMRLAFSIAISVDAEVILIDEILAVGDAHFQNKCFNRIDELRRAGKTIVLVTHALDTVQRFCDHVMWLDGGSIRMTGTPADVLPEYSSAVR